MSDKTNLLRETVDDLARLNLSHNDIVYIGSDPSGPPPYHSCTWDEYKRLAKIDYDSGYGAQEIARDLIIVFKDGSYLCRDEYDGAESWRYMQPVVIPSHTKKIKKLKDTDRRTGWYTLDDIN